jgi:hypothetical protein
MPGAHHDDVVLFGKYLHRKNSFENALGRSFDSLRSLRISPAGSNARKPVQPRIRRGRHQLRRRRIVR